MSVDSPSPPPISSATPARYIDCPGSVEFVQDMRSALPPIHTPWWCARLMSWKVPQLQLVLRELEERKVQSFLFLNKIDKADKRVRETLKLCSRPRACRCCCARFRFGKMGSSASLRRSLGGSTRHNFVYRDAARAIVRFRQRISTSRKDARFTT